jgi:hypothetical protein
MDAGNPERKWLGSSETTETQVLLQRGEVGELAEINPGFL